MQEVFFPGKIFYTDYKIPRPILPSAAFISLSIHMLHAELHAQPVKSTRRPTGTDAEPHQAAGTGAIKERTGKLFGLSALCTIGWIKGDSFLFEFCYNLIYPYIYNYITYGCKEINY